MPILLAMGLAAAVPAPASPAATQDIVVEGRRVERRNVAAAVRSIGGAEALGGFVTQYARWTWPVCVSIAGLPRDGGQMVADRIGSIAREVGLQTKGPGCAPNIGIAFTSDPRGFIRQVVANTPNRFAGVPRPVLAKAEESHDVVRWIGSTSFASSEGDPAEEGGFMLQGHSVTRLPQWGSSNITAATRTFTTGMTIIVDASRIGHVNYGQLAAYLALVALARVNVNAQVAPMPTILSLFQGATDPPQDLTAFDRAYLKAFYTVDAALPAEQQRMALTGLITRALASAGG